MQYTSSSRLEKIVERLWYLLGLLLAESCSVSRLEAARVWGWRLLQRTRRERDPGAGTQT